MKKVARNHCFYILFTLLLVTSSCVKEMDFNGVKDITLEPQMKISVAHAEISTQDIVAIIDKQVAGNGIPDSKADPFYTGSLPVPTQSADVDLTSVDDAMEYLQSATLNFNFINTTPRDITITVSMYKKDNTPIDTFKESLPKSNNDTITVPRDYGGGTGHADIEALKKLAKLEIDITVKGGTDLRTDPSGKFELTTVGLFDFAYDPSEGLP